MKRKFFQACYAHPDTGWGVINTSANIPQSLIDDFSAVERGNAGAAAGTVVPMGESETPSCMMEIYCRNDTVGLVRVQYGLSDGQGRPISFAHGYLFPDAYTILKRPNELLCIRRENFADQRISKEERAAIRSTPGAFNRELIERSASDMIPAGLSMRTPFTLKNALQRCGMTEAAYRTFVNAVYAHLLSTNTEKNLYVKTDGSEEYAWNLLYLTYSAIPYSMRTLLSASTCLHAGQHNTKLIFCAELPDGMPQIDPVSGDNNVMSETVEKRLKERNPVISAAIDYAMKGRQDQFFKFIETYLQLMGNERMNTMPVINLAYRFCKKEYNLPDRLPGALYGWLALPVKNTADWERVVCYILAKAAEQEVDVGAEVKKMLLSRMETSVTEEFANNVKQFLVSSGERK